MSKATIIISTKNRINDLRRAIISCLKQECDLDVLVLDDCSSDQTFEVIKDEFPSVNIYQGKSCRRQMYRRNQGASLSTSGFLIFIDDDCEFSSNDIISKNLELFDDEKVGAVAIPIQNITHEKFIRQISPDEKVTYLISDPIEGAFAIRRKVYVELGGYNTSFVREGEGSDLSIRMLDAGYFIRAGFSAPIFHYHSPVRDSKLSHVFGPRNLILFAYLNVPLRYFFIQLAGSTLMAICHGFSVGHPILKIYGLMRGYCACLFVLSKRQPVSVKTYKAYRKIKADGMLSRDRFLQL